MAVQRIVTDLDLGDLPVEVVAPPVALGPWSANEVLVVSADPEVLDAAGALGAHRIVPAGTEATIAAVRQFLDLLHR